MVEKSASQPMPNLSELGATTSVPIEAITDGPEIKWTVDGPLMHWAGHMHWLTIRERVRLFLERTTIDAIAAERFPHLAKMRATLASKALGEPHA